MAATSTVYSIPRPPSQQPEASLSLFHDGPIVPGFNKYLRDRSKYALAATTLLLASNQVHWACVTSAFSVYNLKAGTLLSSKNFKWMLLSVVSFVVSLLCVVLQAGSRLLDDDRDHSFQTRLSFWSLAMRTVWWPILTLVLVCTWFAGVPIQIEEVNSSTSAKKAD
jgi:hypothetical protein